jgi:L-idonate 5-dehydrogenase
MGFTLGQLVDVSPSPALRPRAVILQPGLGGDMTLPMMAITAKDLDLRGSFRFHAELAVGVALLQPAQISFAG